MEFLETLLFFAMLEDNNDSDYEYDCEPDAYYDEFLDDGYDDDFYDYNDEYIF